MKYIKEYNNINWTFDYEYWDEQDSNYNDEDIKKGDIVYCYKNSKYLTKGMYYKVTYVSDYLIIAGGSPFKKKSIDKDKIHRDNNNHLPYFINHLYKKPNKTNTHNSYANIQEDIQWEFDDEDENNFNSDIPFKIVDLYHHLNNNLKATINWLNTNLKGKSITIYDNTIYDKNNLIQKGVVSDKHKFKYHPFESMLDNGKKNGRISTFMGKGILLYDEITITD